MIMRPNITTQNLKRIYQSTTSNNKYKCEQEEPSVSHWYAMLTKNISTSPIYSSFAVFPTTSMMVF